MKKSVRKATRRINSLFSTATGITPKNVQRKLPGQAPGTLVHTGIRKLDEILLTVHDFDEEHFSSFPIKKIEKSEPYLNDESKTWIQVRGLHDIDKLQAIWEYFGLHPLVQEDIVNTAQRPKIEPYPNHVFFVIRMITHTSEEDNPSDLKTEQISIVLGKNYVLSFQESDDSVFDPVIKRLELEGTRLRKLGPDYLAYALIDTLVDHYYQALDLIGESIEALEEQIVRDPRDQQLQKIHSMRRDLIFFRKSVWSLRDGINSLIRDESPLINDEVKVFLRDVYDHVIQVIDSIEHSRELIYSLYDMYMSGLSHRMNEVMKVLTIIATIFIPLTFIAGIYGMNFNPDASPYSMPELNWYYGYPIFLGVMFIISILMVIFFRRKGWM